MFLPRIPSSHPVAKLLSNGPSCPRILSTYRLLSFPHIDFPPFHKSTSLFSTYRSLHQFLPERPWYLSPLDVGWTLGGRCAGSCLALSIVRYQFNRPRGREVCPVHSLLIHCASISDVSPTLVTSPCPPIRMNNVSLPIETARSPKWFLGHAQDTVEANCPL